MPTQPSASLLAIYPHITTRDRLLLQLLDDHQVLTTDQIHRMLFHARRTCQIRLGELAALGLLDRFRFARAGGGSQPWHWTLGHHGRRFQAAAHQRPEPTAWTSRQTVHRLSANPRLRHLLTVNEFFVRLSAHARHHTGARLERWWSESMTTKQFRTITADGHGVWTVGDTTVGFFLEADTGSEPLSRVVAKLDRYADLVRRGGPRYPVLFWLGSGQREDHLHRQLVARPDVPVATATHTSDPADAVWLPTGVTGRVRLAALPSDHGQPVADNPNYDEGILIL
ncbi:replication-relaxation family protein [Micromonospora sp. WMMD812]|uniref:replication-relaxation family protein n=1 Tax=Micromonospora sp. WMMD812 TaxID=3015152 RepID=UPI00248B8B49|nr:replication-relaxation family protein [Micromonospora sp. WMMD812]WBB69186.1 replication-relaxation family protein [Micromonospora sp. WMMD812]